MVLVCINWSVLPVCADGTPNTQINKVVCHPTLPIIVTGHEDKYIRFYDANTGTPVHAVLCSLCACHLVYEDGWLRKELILCCYSPGKAIHSMTAHMDAVTGLAVDPHGLYLLSGSKSLSISPSGC